MKIIGDCRALVLSGFALWFTVSHADSLVGPNTKPPIAPVRPFNEVLYGVTVEDPYRYMESLDAETIGWLKAQGAYTRSILDAIHPRAALEQRLADFGASFGVILPPSFGAQPYQVYSGRLFYTEREPGSDNLDLFVKDTSGTRKLIDVAKLRATHDGKPYAINYFQASPDGAKVAVGISEGGSEDTSIFVYDVQTGRQIAGPVDRAQYAGPSWTDDGKNLYIMRLALLKPGDAPTAKYLNATAQVWDLKTEPIDLIGTSVGNAAKLNLTPPELPFIQLFPGSPIAVFDNDYGVQNEQELWVAPVTTAADANAPWKLLAARNDNVTAMDVRGEEIYLLSHQDAPTFKVLELHESRNIAEARTVVPARADRVIESIHAASDGLYVLAREGIYSHLLCLSVKGDAVREIRLPFKGYISAAFTDPRKPGLTLTLESWAVPATEFVYEPEHGRFVDLKLGTRPTYDAAQFQVRDLQAEAGDGTKVPLTLVEPRAAKGPQIVLLHAYGSYGISYLPEFNPRIIAFMREGADYAVCHVRGGGELGEAWRLGGKDANKPNTWRDLIACGEDLIARGVTTKGLLFIIGGSAGGITMGRAMTERPDLFAGVIDQVPAANALRSEFSPNGPPNIPEFGTVSTEQGFKNLLAMDSYQAVQGGTQYPAVLITTGLNDPRVSPWEPGKFAARLQASDTASPVLLRVEEEAGHGIGSTKTQKDQEYADIASFIFWRAGRSGWQPELSVH